MFRPILITCLLSTVGVAGASVIQAETGPPVIQELMGGCSLTCSFPWNAEASQEKLAAINDSEAGTAWTGARVGDTLVFRFPKDLPRELNGTPFYGIDLANGRQRPAEAFGEYGRIKSLRLSHNGKPVHTIRWGDTRRWQQAEFDDIFLNVGDTLTLEILEIYPGTKFPTAALTEIVLQGAH